MGSRISLAGKTRGNMLKLFLLSVILFSYTSAVTPTCQNLWGNQIQEQQRNPVGEQCTFPFRTEHGINYPGADMLHPGVPTRSLQECACLCQKVCGCVLFVWKAQSTRCWLKNRVTPPHKWIPIAGIPTGGRRD